MDSSIKSIFVRPFQTHNRAHTHTQLEPIHPHLEYAAAVWPPHIEKDIQQIEYVQRRATKQLPTISKPTYSERLTTT